MGLEVPTPVTQVTHSTGRLHALDNLRAVMMWLGIVLHVAVIYMVAPSPLPWRDSHTSQWADLLVVLIHSFRMPVFFILAGFFVALLVQGHGLRGMLRNRFMRLGLPFLLLWPVIFLACALLAMLFVHRMARGTWGLDPSLIPPREGMPKWNTVHLWFLWMLMWFSVFTALLAPLTKSMPDALRRVASSVFERFASSTWAFALLSLPPGVLGAFYKDGVVLASGSFVPPLTEWLHNGLFFVFGLALFVHRTRLLALYQRRWSAYAGAGLVFFTVALTLSGLQRAQVVTLANFPFWFALAYNCCTWLWSFALIGLFVRSFGHQNPVMDYLAQGSYWVYVIHMPLTIGFGALLYGLDLPALVKMAINVVATTALSLVSYHLVVRSTPLGGLLNGRRHPFTTCYFLPSFWSKVIHSNAQETR